MSSQTELRTAITAQIVDALTAGGLPPWRQPWRADKNCGTPANVVSERSYTGINPLLLAIAAQKHTFQSRWWGTYRQWAEIGGQVKARPSNVPPGRRGTQIVFCRPVTKTEKTPDGDEERDGPDGRAVSGEVLRVGRGRGVPDPRLRRVHSPPDVLCGFHIHPHLLRHTMAHQFLADSGNDLVALAQILGRENLNTTARYTKRTQQQLGEASEKLTY